MEPLHNTIPHPYAAEAQARWHDTPAYGQYAEKTRGYTRDTWQQLAGDMEKIFARFAECMEQGLSPDSPDARHLAAALQSHITAHYYLCTDEMLRCLGQMYTQDQRFRENIDRHGIGTADYVCRAIHSHCGK